MQFHNDKTEFVAEHVIRLPHDSQVEDVLRELSSRLGAEYSGRKLRLLEVYHSKIFKVQERAACASFRHIWKFSSCADGTLGSYAVYVVSVSWSEATDVC